MKDIFGQLQLCCHMMVVAPALVIRRQLQLLLTLKQTDRQLEAVVASILLSRWLVARVFDLARCLGGLLKVYRCIQPKYKGK